MTTQTLVYTVVSVALTARSVPAVTVYTSEEVALAAFRLALADLKAAHPEAIETFGLSSRVMSITRFAALLLPVAGDYKDWRPVASVTLRSHALEAVEASEVVRMPSIAVTVGPAEEA